MEPVIERLPGNGRVAILRLRSLGDCVLTTPAIRILKTARPDLEIAVLVEDRFRAVFEGNPDIARILPPAPLGSWRPSLCLNLHGGTRSAWITALSGARYRAGFAHFRHQVVYNVRIPRAQEILGLERKVHTAEHLASAMFFLGAPACEIPRARLSGTGWVACASRWALQSTGQEACATGTETAVLHPVASAPDKTWHADGFLAVAAHLKEAGVEPVFIGGPGDDLSSFQGYHTVSGAPLAEIKQLLSQAALFVGNDSGPAHMAAAFGIPVVVIFGASDPIVWGPWHTPGEIITSTAGIHSITTNQVLDAIARLRVRV